MLYIHKIVYFCYEMKGYLLRTNDAAIFLMEENYYTFKYINLAIPIRLQICISFCENLVRFKRCHQFGDSFSHQDSQYLLKNH